MSTTRLAEIDPTATLRGDVDLADDVIVGPQCVIDGTLGPIRVGAGTRLVGNAWLCGPLEIGCRNLVYPFACLGFAPQSVSFDAGRAGRGAVIGDDNVFREGATVHRAMTDGGPTVIGNRNWFMVNSHAGHDAKVADHCILANTAVLGGHVIMGERANVGGNTPVHQFARIGRGAMLGGGLALRRDIPPFFMLTEVGVVGGINLVGMRRQGLAEDVIQDVRWVYKTLYRRSLPVSQALTELRARADRPIIAEYVEFIETSKRGITPGHGRRERR